MPTCHIATWLQKNSFLVTRICATNALQCWSTHKALCHFNMLIWLQSTSSEQLAPPPNLPPPPPPPQGQGQERIGPPPALGRPSDRRRGPSRGASDVQATANNRPGSQEQQKEQPSSQQQGQPQQVQPITQHCIMQDTMQS